MSSEWPDATERLAIALHREACIRRGAVAIWDGQGTNRAYWRRKARACAPTASPESGPLGPKMQSTPSSLSDITRLREALEPFADVDGEGSDDYPDETKVEVKFGRTTHYAIKLGDFRRASEALSSVVGEGGEGLRSSNASRAATRDHGLAAAEAEPSAASEPCSYCGDGDPVPARGYWQCPTCDAEWNVDEDEPESAATESPSPSEKGAR